MSRTLSCSECNYSSVEKEASSIMETVRRWSHYLHGKTFTLVTDQRSVAFKFDNTRPGKIKNAKMLMWRIELGAFSYVIKYRSGKENVAPEVFV